jgi:hypothetical protein
MALSNNEQALSSPFFSNFLYPSLISALTTFPILLDEKRKFYPYQSFIRLDDLILQIGARFVARIPMEFRLTVAICLQLSKSYSEDG